MMNNELKKIIKEEIDKVVEKVLDDEIKEGKDLKDICDNYNNNPNINCLKNGHMTKVNNYINRIENKYRILVKIYVSARSKENKVINENIMKCTLISNCIDFLECLKETKKYIDNLEKVKEILEGTFKE